MSTVPPLLSVPDVVRAVSTGSQLFASSRRTVGVYKLEGQIGQGGCGKVGVASVAGKSKARVAVKVLQGEGAAEALRKEAAAQVACHDHPNIPTCHDLLQTKTKCFLVMEHATNGDLFDHVSNHGPLPPAAAERVMRQLVSAVAHMHAKGFAHRDIKPENVLLTGERGETKALLCDFGHATAWTDKDGLLTRACGTVRCLPPEMFIVDDVTNKRKYNPQLVDAFGLGVVLFYMLTGRFPFDGPTPSDTARNIVDGVPTAPFPKDASAECSDLLLGLLERRPKNRLTVQEALAHPFLAHNQRQSS